MRGRVAGLAYIGAAVLLMGAAVAISPELAPRNAGAWQSAPGTVRALSLAYPVAAYAGGVAALAAFCAYIR